MGLADLLEDLSQLTLHHLDRSVDYRNFVLSRFPDWSPSSYESLPYLPVTVFKSRILKSVRDQQLTLVMESSGTSGSGKSMIAIDSETSQLQARALAGSFSRNFGKRRMPMIFLASEPNSVSNYSASDAAMNGFGRFASARFFVYDQQGAFDGKGLLRFMESHAADSFLFVGFTFRVWKFLQDSREISHEIRKYNSSLLHGGGWKKLFSESVDRETFVEAVSRSLGCHVVKNYYGMIEQTGSVYFECANGVLHFPDEGYALIRHPLTMEVLKDGQLGVIQVLSSIQRSYPGHSVLTEDVGRKFASCACGAVSQGLQIEGRLQESEIRGCSDAVA